MFTITRCYIKYVIKDVIKTCGLDIMLSMILKEMVCDKHCFYSDNGISSVIIFANRPVFIFWWPVTRLECSKAQRWWGTRARTNRCPSQLKELQIHDKLSLVWTFDSNYRGKKSRLLLLPVCLWGETTMISISPSTLAKMVSLFRPEYLSTRWIDLVCQSVQYNHLSCYSEIKEQWLRSLFTEVQIKYFLFHIAATIYENYFKHQQVKRIISLWVLLHKQHCRCSHQVPPYLCQSKGVWYLADQHLT